MTQQPSFSSVDSEIFTSQIFNTLYYDKRSLKILLEERSELMKKLNLKPQRGNYEDITNSVLLLFNQHPLQLQPTNFLVLKDGGITDYKYIPLCKSCNRSVYVTVHNNSGKIVCTSPKCKRVILEQFQIKKKSEISQKQTQHSVKSIKNSVVQVFTQKPDKEAIMKTIQRIFK